MSGHLADLSIQEAAARLRDGSLSSLDLTRAHLERIAERDQAYHAFVYVDIDGALAEAARADDALRRGDA